MVLSQSHAMSCVSTEQNVSAEFGRRDASTFCSLETSIATTTHCYLILREALPWYDEVCNELESWYVLEMGVGEKGLHIKPITHKRFGLCRSPVTGQIKRPMTSSEVIRGLLVRRLKDSWVAPVNERQ